MGGGLSVICGVPPKNSKNSDQNLPQNQSKRSLPPHLSVLTGEGHRVLPVNYLLLVLGSLKDVIQSVQNAKFSCH